MDGVAGERVERHGRSSQLDRSGRQIVDIGNANIRTERKVQPAASGAKQELIISWQAGIASRNAENECVWRNRTDTIHIWRRQGGVELLVGQICAAEVFAAIRSGRNLELMSLGEIRSRRPVGIDNAFGKKVQNPLVPALGHIRSEEMIKAAIL